MSGPETSTTDNGRRGRGRPRAPETDAAILRAALELFVERGVEGASIEAIARQAGVGKLTVYRRWAGKEELIAAAIETSRAGIPEPTAADFADLPVPELVRGLLPSAAAALTDPHFHGLIAQVYGSSRTHPTIMATYWEHYVLPRRRATRLLLERAQREGLLAPEADLEVLMDMMVGAVMYRVIQPEPLNADTALRYLEAVYRQAGLLPA
ncbi:TetR/AcrR family transcriptional regulator [Crossiella sp. CA198]|uniref:TetR/AcrR family transcriptional regulator n=1 Tax=Crossiella sp. CA198 TaxID=3455607 RepID=UPI003F8D87BB